MSPTSSGFMYLFSPSLMQPYRCIKDGENKYMNIENVMQRDAEI
jgi:hypothetical protein